MKKILAIFLAVMIIFSISVPSFAAYIDLNANAKTGNSIAVYENSSKYTITIPDYIIPVKQNEEGNVYNVTTKDVLLADSQTLDVTVEYDNFLTDSRGAELEYSLNNTDKTVIETGAVILSQDAGSPEATSSKDFTAYLTEDVLFAGVFTDVVTFNCSIKSGETTPEEVITFYSSDEIDVQEELYPIGATDPYYVVVSFNEDFSVATITKNGENSDGLMVDWTDYSSGLPLAHPIYERRDTVKKIVVEYGVLNIGDQAFAGMKSDGTELNEVVLADSVTSIGNYVFADCDGLESVTFPKSIVSIGNYIFHENSSIKTIFGYSGSYAETWVTENPQTTGSSSHTITFVAIDGETEPDVPEEENPYEATEQWIEESGIADTTKSYVETYNISYYAALLVALTEGDAEAITLAQQSDAAVEEYVNAGIGMDVNEYFAENIGATAHQVAHYIEYNEWVD